MTIRRTLATMGMAVVVLAAVSGCRSDVVKVDPRDPNSPRYPYLAHEFALLQLAVDDIQELEKKKQYGRIYDDYASDGFRQNVSRRKFLVMANCTEEHLGALSEYDDRNLSFNRNQMPDKNKPALDSITRRALRSKAGQVQEQLVFASDGLHFKLNGLYWISEEEHFLKCMQAADKLAAEPKAAPAPPTAEKPASKAPGPPDADKPAAEKPASPEKPATQADRPAPAKAEPKPAADTGHAPIKPAAPTKPAEKPTTPEKPAD